MAAIDEPEALRSTQEVKRTCVFCGRTPLSREHVFPRWLTTVLPDQERSRGQDTAMVYLDGSGNSKPLMNHREMKEQFTSTTVTRVCRECNHGWMNDLETSVRPSLSQLVRGQAVYLNRETLLTLATWIAKTCLMADFTYPESSAIPLGDYRWMFKTKQPPPLMQIWMVPIQGNDWALRMEHIAVLYGDPSIIDASQPYNAYSTTIGLGKVGFCVMGTTNSELFLPRLEEIPPLKAFRLWPDPSGLEWSPGSALDDWSVWLLSDIFRLWFKNDDELFVRLTELQARQ